MKCRANCISNKNGGCTNEGFLNSERTMALDMQEVITCVYFKEKILSLIEEHTGRITAETELKFLQERYDNLEKEFNKYFNYFNNKYSDEIGMLLRKSPEEILQLIKEAENEIYS